MVFEIFLAEDYTLNLVYYNRTCSFLPIDPGHIASLLRVKMQLSNFSKKKSESFLHYVKLDFDILNIRFELDISRRIRTTNIPREQNRQFITKWAMKRISIRSRP